MSNFRRVLLLPAKVVETLSWLLPRPQKGDGNRYGFLVFTFVYITFSPEHCEFGREYNTKKNMPRPI